MQASGAKPKPGVPVSQVEQEQLAPGLLSFLAVGQQGE